MVLSYIQAEPIIQAIKSGESQVETSLDLNLSRTTINIVWQGVVLPDGQKLNLKQLEKIVKKDNKCFLIQDNEIIPIQEFSETTEWMRTLYPTESAPTTLVSGIHMHRIKDVTPWEHARLMVKALGFMDGKKVLDTATGLGYTAIQAAQRADHVITVEIDPSAIEIAKLNPWSQKLFDNPKIILIVGNFLEEIEKFDEGEYELIIHDPPTFKLSGELYSREFYQQLNRVLKRGGKLFHYIGDPESEIGSMVTKGVVQRLKNAGFSKIEKIPQAFGLVAGK